MPTLADFSGSDIFIDSNIFIFDATVTGPYEECEKFLMKIKHGEIIGYTNPIIIEEVYHKLLILEVCNKYQIKPFSAVRFIKENPHILAEIDKPGKIIDEILDYRGLRVLEIGYHVILEAKKIFNLLLGSDAIHAATCKMYEISDIATNDGDFKRVDFLKRWEPSPWK
ncbi:MAG: PIN domain-containing protein [Candidatus Methanoperedens sp.]|nr:PIN domain-containing protein [Candidatus Methanoperedens sp.]